MHHHETTSHDLNDVSSSRGVALERKLIEQLLKLESSLTCLMDSYHDEVMPANGHFSDSWTDDKDGSQQWFLAQPPSALTKDVLENGCHQTRHLCRLHKVEFTLDYQELVYRLVDKSILSLPELHGAYVTDAMAAKFILSQPMDTLKSKLNWSVMLKKPFFRPGPLFFNALVLRKLNVVSGLGVSGRELIRDDVLKAVLLKNGDCSPSLITHNYFDRSHVIVDLVRNGWSPPKQEGLPDESSTQTNPELSVSTILYSFSKLQLGDEYIKAVQEGLIRRHPIQDVVLQANTPSKKDSLILLYSKEELMPYIKHDHYTKGLLLDQALGL
jgi:hypothetical protein